MLLPKDIKITSGYSYEGYMIKDYLGFLSGETALGTGFFSEYAASFSDFFGIQNESFSKKLVQAKSASIEKLQRAVIAVGGNAVIGVDIDYHAFTGNMIGVIASGTAVCIEEITSIDPSIYFRNSVSAVNYNLSSTVRPLHLNITQYENHFELECCFRKYNEAIIDYLQCRIILLTVFGDEIDIGKKSLKLTEVSDTLLSAKISISTIEDIQIVNSTKISVNKLYSNGVTQDIDLNEEHFLSIEDVTRLRSGYNTDAVIDAKVEDDLWICSCGTQNPIGIPCSLCSRTMEAAISFSLEDFIKEAELLDTSGAIYRLFMSLELNIDDILVEIESILKTNSILEKTYKNTKKDTIIQLKRLLKI